MKKILPTIGIIALLILFEISCSSFFSFQERSYFFLFSFLAISVVKKGFFRALPRSLFTVVVFEGVVQSSIGPISLYGVLFVYGISFLLRRLHLEYGGEKVFLALAAGFGMALYPVFAYSNMHFFRSFPLETFFGWLFFQNIVLGAIVFLIMLRLFGRSEESSIPLAASFSK